MSKREVVKDLEYWARQAAARTERRRIRRAIAPALAFIRSFNGNDFEKRIQYAGIIDRATKAPKRKVTKEGTTP